MPVLLITGGARRLGRIIIEYFVQKGWDIAFTCNSSVQEAQEIVAQNSKNIKIKFYQGDFCTELFRSKLISRVLADFHNIDLLINNASIFERCSVYEVQEAELDNNFAIHVKTPLILAQNLVKFKQKSKIINITDVMVTKNATEFFPYILTKKSLSSLTKILAKKLAPQIQVNEICPAMILDDIDSANQDFKAEREQKLPAGRRPEPLELIKAIEYFVDNNCYGQCLFVDSGEHIL